MAFRITFSSEVDQLTDMVNTTPLSININARLAAAAAAHCRKHGLTLDTFLEHLVYDFLEEELDLADYHKRKTEPTFPIEEIAG